LEEEECSTRERTVDKWGRRVSTRIWEYWASMP